MKIMKNSFYIFCITFALFCSVFAVKAQQKDKRATVSLSSGITLTFTSKTEPASYGLKDIGSFEAAGKNSVVHRAYLDQANRVYFGYDVVVENTGEAGEYKLTFKPLSPIKYVFVSNDVITDRGEKTTRSGELKAMALQKYPEPQQIRNGDTVEFEVLINPKTGVKIIDSIKVSLSFNAPPPSQKNQVSKPFSKSNEDAAADFSVDEIELSIKNSQLRVGDKWLTGRGNDSKFDISGALLWLYLPNQGRFIFSLVSRKGYDFQKIGTVQSNKISFTMDDVKYDWISDSPIVTGGNKRWNLWVLHDPGFRPNVALSKQIPYQAGSASQIEQLIKKK